MGSGAADFKERGMLLGLHVRSLNFSPVENVLREVNFDEITGDNL